MGATHQTPNMAVGRGAICSFRFVHGLTGCAALHPLYEFMFESGNQTGLRLLFELS
jgi:hypothetical protein